MPESVLAVPDIVIAPAGWVKAPEPDVAKFPDISRFTPGKTVTFIPDIIKLLKFCVGIPLITDPEPFIVTVDVPCINVPLFFHFAIECENVFPLKVVEAPILSSPFTEIFAPAVYETEVPAPGKLDNEPATVKAVAGIVFVAAPPELLRTRFPYVAAETG